MTHPTDADGFGIYPHRFSQDGRFFPGGYIDKYHAGEPIARGYVDTGDQVFVDKFTYNFRFPRRGDVFVFSTRDITGIPMDDPMSNRSSTSNAWRVCPTINSASISRSFTSTAPLAQEPGFRARDDARRMATGATRTRWAFYLRTPEDMFTVPPKSYFALGDNSFNSSDSRKWGVVPANNVVGRGLVVYWPFTWHWGLIR